MLSNEKNSKKIINLVKNKTLYKAIFNLDEK
jgi:hypothetical protein